LLTHQPTGPGYLDACIQHLQNYHQQSQDIICDSLDGEKMQEIRQHLSGSDVLPIPIVASTDGGLLFCRNNIHIWPLWVSFHCRPPNVRYAQHELGLLGLWIGRDKPPMSSFFQNFVSQDLIQNSQFIVALPDRAPVSCQAFLLALTADIPARSAIVKHAGHSCEFSCWHCLIKMRVVDSKHLFDHRFLNGEPELNLRTATSIAADAVAYENDLHRFIALKRQDPTTVAKMPNHVNGICGVSILSKVPLIRIPDDLVVDTMHELYNLFAEIGEHFFGPTNADKEWSLHHHLKQIDDDLMQIRIPHCKSEPPRSIRIREKWKAAEWRFFFFYLLLPVMDKYASQHQEKYKTNIALLIGALRIFSGNTIYRESCRTRPQNAPTFEDAQRWLFRFVESWEILYGSSTFAIHLVLHLPRLVLRYGPLWTVSCFPFESAIHWLLRHCHGRKGGLAERMFASYFENLELLGLLSEGNIKPASPFYSIFQKLKLGHLINDFAIVPSTYHRLVDGAFACFGVGAAKKFVATIPTGKNQLDVALQQVPDLIPGEPILVFKKFSLNGRLYCSTEYDANYVTRRDSRAFVYMDGFGVERPAVAQFFFWCAQSAKAYFAALPLKFDDKNPLEQPKHHHSVWYAHPPSPETKILRLSRWNLFGDGSCCLISNRG
jgi:hypothetical protein